MYVRELLRFGAKFKCDISLWFVDVVVPCFFYCKFVIFALLTDCPFYKVCLPAVRSTRVLLFAILFLVGVFVSWIGVFVVFSCNLPWMKKLL